MRRSTSRSRCWRSGWRCSAAWWPARSAACAPHGCAPRTPSGTSTEDTHMNDDLLYELLDVVKSYGTGDTLVNAVAGVSLNVERGEFVVVAGPSGSGKTSLLQ